MAVVTPPPPGVAAFYSALDPHTAYAEYTQSLFDRLGLLCAFDVSSARVIDISTNDGPEAAELRPDDLVERWAGRSDAPTQLAAKRLIEIGVGGLVYRSLQHQSGFNLVLWLWTKPSPARVRLVDRLGEAVTRPLFRACHCLRAERGQYPKQRQVRIISERVNQVNT